MKKDLFKNANSIVRDNEMEMAENLDPDKKNNEVSQDCDGKVITLKYNGNVMKIEDSDYNLIDKDTSNPNYKFTQFISSNENMGTNNFVVKINDKDKSVTKRVIKFVNSNIDNIEEINEISALNKLNNSIEVCKMYGYGFCKLTINGITSKAYYIIMKMYSSSDICQYYKKIFSVEAEKLGVKKFFIDIPHLDEEGYHKARTQNNGALVSGRPEYQEGLRKLIGSENDPDKRDTLRKVFRKITKVTLSQFMGKFKGLVKELAAIHKLGIAHLDIKSDNILADLNDDAERVFTLIDWGSSGKNSSNTVVKYTKNINMSIDSEFRTPEQNDIEMLCRMLAKIIDPSLMNIKASSHNEIEELEKGLKDAGADKYIINFILDTLSGKITTARGLYERIKHNYFNSAWLNQKNFIRGRSVAAIVVIIALSIALGINLNSGSTTQSESQVKSNSIDDSTKSNIENTYFNSHEWKDETLKTWIINSFNSPEYIGQSFVDMQTLLINTDTESGLMAKKIKTADGIPFDKELSFFKSISGTGDEYEYFYPSSNNDQNKAKLKKQDRNSTIASFDDIKELFPNTNTIVIANCNIPENFNAFNEMRYLENVILFNCNVTSLLPFGNVNTLLIKNCDDDIKTPLSAYDLSNLKSVKNLSLNGFELDLSSLDKLQNLNYLDLTESIYDYSKFGLLCQGIQELIIENVSVENLSLFCNSDFQGALYIYNSNFASKVSDLCKVIDRRTNTIIFNNCFFSSESEVENLGKSYTYGRMGFLNAYTLDKARIIFKFNNSNACVYIYGEIYSYEEKQ